MLGAIPWAVVTAAFIAVVPLDAQVRPMSAEVPAPARARAPGASAADMARNWYGELQRLSGHLAQVHERALQNPELRRRRDALMQGIQQAMDAADPELRTLASRARQIPAEVQTAQRRGDAPRLRSLDREAAQIRARFMNVEAGVMRQPSVARQVRAYEELLRREMMRIEPLTESLLARSADLQRLLQAALGQQQQD
ncbi:MAG TPA: hypothetical protein VGB24_18075 [Longimicrobium sp.]|uniref:hypothetical protein n=1 Tax=Longimicrobium sp. TaxID=2029185 RepID=UPI002EDA4D50